MLLEAAYAAGDVVRYEDAVLLFSSQIASLHVSEKTGKYLGAASAAQIREDTIIPFVAGCCKRGIS